MPRHPKPPTAANIRTALRRLGPSASAIAASLKRRRLKGTPNAACSCPISNYLRRTFPSTGFSTTHTLLYIHPWGSEFNPTFHRITIRPSKPISRFISDFDAGIYPSLIKTT